ncbi:hypothetical protein QDR37_04440 [Amnibacterium sp. CER49]|uniref:hypothetical protein n=1 Tax=Amnibacterium sp. CER49 TaxID=3039161 RepID=UPI0024470851|nr:hypothetical protein [Amnibacterium sp. CER49]MDH2443193.1 hypothetical protein [Amnibacterium sp. CER49]
MGLQDARIPVEPQVWLTQRYRADLLVDGWLPVEVDGASTHATPEGFEHDRERDATLAWFLSHPLRFSQRLVVDDLPFVVGAVRRVWLGGPPRR